MLRDVLLATEEARDEYLGVGRAMGVAHYHALVDAVTVAEERGMDPLPVLRDAVLIMCRALSATQDELVKHALRTPGPIPFGLGWGEPK